MLTRTLFLANIPQAIQPSPLKQANGQDRLLFSGTQAEPIEDAGLIQVLRNAGNAVSIVLELAYRNRLASPDDLLPMTQDLLNIQEVFAPGLAMQLIQWPDQPQAWQYARRDDLAKMLTEYDGNKSRLEKGKRPQNFKALQTAVNSGLWPDAAIALPMDRIDKIETPLDKEYEWTANLRQNLQGYCDGGRRQYIARRHITGMLKTSNVPFVLTGSADISRRLMGLHRLLQRHPKLARYIPILGEIYDDKTRH